MDTSTLHIRWFIKRDLPEALAIEGDLSHPWSEADFYKALTARNIYGFVTESGPVHGYFLYEIHKNRLNILNMAVRLSMRRQGLGSAMIAKMKRKLQDGKREILTAEVRETNLEAQQFLRSQGFLATRVLRDYYSGNEDGYRFELRA